MEVTVRQEGKAVEGIEIDLRRGFGGMGGNSLSSVTNANGVAVVTEVPEGSYVIQTNRDGTDFDTELMKKRSVVVKPGETSKFSLKLQPVTGVLLHGKLTMNGQPLFTTCVLVGLGPLKSIIKQGAVGAGGAFEFRNLAPGKYELHARESRRQQCRPLHFWTWHRKGTSRSTRTSKALWSAAMSARPPIVQRSVARSPWFCVPTGCC